jgi:YVTN family beta-propeller protein
MFPSGEGGRELAYVLNYGEHSVLVVDPEAMTVVAKVEVAKAPFYMVHNPVRKEGYVLNFETDSISVLDLDPSSATYHTVKGEWK